MTDGLEQLIPYVSPIAHLLRDASISEIMVNQDGKVFSERDGVITREPFIYPSADLRAASRRIARELGRDINEQEPIFEGRLPSGARVTIIEPPCSVGGTVLTIRKLNFTRWSLDALVDNKTLSEGQAGLLASVVRRGANILISGATSSGKTSLLNALAAHIPENDRVVVIEDVTELAFTQPNVVRLEARLKDPKVTIRDLLRTTMRLRPEHIVIGETRGAEALTFIEMLNTGHSGTLLSIHASSCIDSLDRLFLCALMAEDRVPERFLKESIGRHVHVLVHMVRVNGRRMVDEVRRVKGYNSHVGCFELI